MGARRLHGPHHGAQKSTSTGVPDLRTDSSKLPSVKVWTLSLAIVSPVLGPSALSPQRLVFVPCLRARLYILIVLRAERSQELSRRMPAAWSARHRGCVLKDRQSPLQRCEQCRTSVAPEHESRRGRSLWREIPNRVGKPADVADDRNRAVPQAYIWLSPHGSNRDGIRKMSAPAFDEMSELLVEVDADADSIADDRAASAVHKS